MRWDRHHIQMSGAHRNISGSEFMTWQQKSSTSQWMEDQSRLSSQWIALHRMSKVGAENYVAKYFKVLVWGVLVWHIQIIPTYGKSKNICDMNYFVAITMFFHVYQDFTLIEKKVNKSKNIACVIRDYRKLSCIYWEWAQCVVRLQAAMQLPLTAPHLSQIDFTCSSCMLGFKWWGRQKKEKEP